MNSLRKIFVEHQFEKLEKLEKGSIEDLTTASDISDTTEYQYFTCRGVRANQGNKLRKKPLKLNL